MVDYRRPPTWVRSLGEKCLELRVVDRARLSLVFLSSVTLFIAGYFPWNYASVYETYRVDFYPLFASEFTTPLGTLCQILALFFWLGASFSLILFVSSKHSFTIKKDRNG
jgi:hypothetical protein